MSIIIESIQQAPKQRMGRDVIKTNVGTFYLDNRNNLILKKPRFVPGNILIDYSLYNKLIIELKNYNYKKVNQICFQYLVHCMDKLQRKHDFGFTEKEKIDFILTYLPEYKISDITNELGYVTVSMIGNETILPFRDLFYACYYTMILKTIPAIIWD